MAAVVAAAVEWSPSTRGIDLYLRDLAGGVVNAVENGVETVKTPTADPGRTRLLGTIKSMYVGPLSRHGRADAIGYTEMKTLW